MKNEKEILENLEKNIKELSEGRFNFEVIAGPSANKEFDILIECVEKQIDFVNQHPDSKKRFNIMMNFLNKLDSDKLYDSYHTIEEKSGFYNAKKISQAGRVYHENAEKFENSLDIGKEIDALCKLYAYAYERACRMYFKPLAQAITKKKIDSCGSCIEKISEYYPDIEFVLQPFIPHIRNSIDHVDFYYDTTEKMIIFEDRDKPQIKMLISQLRVICTLQTVSDVCMATANFAFELPSYKTSQFYFNKTEEYCKVLNIDFDKAIVVWASTGRNLLSFYNIIEKIVKKRYPSYK